jgi:hypothetical protein
MANVYVNASTIKVAIWFNSYDLITEKRISTNDISISANAVTPSFYVGEGVNINIPTASINCSFNTPLIEINNLLFIKYYFAVPKKVSVFKA